jgi:hypothetical protein
LDKPDPDIEINMDASDDVLCAVQPAKKEFIRLDFNDEEKALIDTHNNSLGYLHSQQCAG